MAARSHYRGHPTYFDEATQLWKYEDGSGTLLDHGSTKGCGRCGKSRTANDHDPCIANLPNVMNACCGHGNDGEAYVQFWDGSRIAGADALRFQEGHTQEI